MTDINVGAKLREGLDRATHTSDWSGFRALLDWLDANGVTTHEIREAYVYPVTEEVLESLNEIVDALGGVVYVSSEEEIVPEPEENEGEDAGTGFFSRLSSRVEDEEEEDSGEM